MAWFDKRILTKAECEEIKKNNADMFEVKRIAAGMLPPGYYIPILLIAGQDKTDYSVTLYTSNAYVLDCQPVILYEEGLAETGRSQRVFTLAMSAGEHEEIFVTVPGLRGVVMDISPDMFDGTFSRVIVPHEAIDNTLRLIAAWSTKQEKEAAAK